MTNNENSTVTDVLGLNKPIEFKIVLDTTSLIILGAVLFITGAAIITYYKFS